MKLIAKNNIIKYINNHPEARVSLLTWLKEYPYLERKNLLSSQQAKSIRGSDFRWFQLDRGDYMIRVKINYSANATQITLVGIKQECEEVINEEFKKNHPDLALEIKTVKVLIESPHPKDFKEIELAKEIEAAADHGIPDGNGFHTETEYEQGLARVIATFDAQPDKPEYNELIALLPLVSSYEDYKLKFPTLRIFEVVKHKMDVFKIIPSELSTFAGNEEEFHQFLSGKLMLSPEILDRLFKILSIPCPISDLHLLG